MLSSQTALELPKPSIPRRHVVTQVIPHNVRVHVMDDKVPKRSGSGVVVGVESTTGGAFSTDFRAGRRCKTKAASKASVLHLTASRTRKPVALPPMAYAQALTAPVGFVRLSRLFIPSVRDRPSCDA